MTTLDLPGLAAWIGQHHTRDLFRLETLDRYRSASDGDDFDRFLRGEPGPDRAAKAGWLERLRGDTDAGRVWRRVRVVSSPLTDYQRYSCEWGYPDNVAAGEQVRVLDQSALRWARQGDFYLIDGEHGAAMAYDPDGRFQSATVFGPTRSEVLLLVAQAAWELATPFSEWWAAHPEHHRATSGAS